MVNSRLKMAGIKNEVQKYKGTLDGLIKIAMEVNTLYITILTILCSDRVTVGLQQTIKNN